MCEFNSINLVNHLNVITIRQFENTNTFMKFKYLSYTFFLLFFALLFITHGDQNVTVCRQSKVK